MRMRGSAKRVGRAGGKGLRAADVEVTTPTKRSAGLSRLLHLYSAWPVISKYRFAPLDQFKHLSPSNAHQEKGW